MRPAIGIAIQILLSHCKGAAAEDASANLPFPLLFDIGGLSTVNLPNLVAGTPRVQLNKIFECPHPCGLLPTITSNGTVINGGIPQLANMTLHLLTLNATFNHNNISVDDDRWIDLDFESWRPLWDKTGWQRPSEQYQNMSIALVQKAHPDWTAEQILLHAQQDWETAAMSTLLGTINFVKKIRPKLKVGMYGYTQNSYWKGYNTSYGPALRADNERMMALFCALDGLFPTVYQFYNSVDDKEYKQKNKDYIYTTVAEAVRIAKEVPIKCKGRSELPVFAYTWHRYHEGAPWEHQLVSDADQQMYWTQSYAAGATGLVMWGNEAPANISGFEAWWKGNFTRMINAWQPQIPARSPEQTEIIV